MMEYIPRDTLETMGFSHLGKNVLISEKASLYGCENIHIGDHVRIDDFCVISAREGEVHIGNYVHIAVFTSLIGAGKIVLSDYSGLSSRVSVYSSSDDYSGEFMTNPTVPEAYTHCIDAPVFIGKHVIVGCGSVILPGVTLNEGVAIGALSLVTKSCQAFSTYMGVPAKKIKNRKRGLLDKETEFNKAQGV